MPAADAAATRAVLSVSTLPVRTPLPIVASGEIGPARFRGARQVFVADSPHRARALQLVAHAAVAACCLWLVALVLGGVGFVGLPAMHVPAGRVSTAHSPHAVVAHDERASQRTSARSVRRASSARPSRPA